MPREPSSVCGRYLSPPRRLPPRLSLNSCCWRSHSPCCLTPTSSFSSFLLFGSCGLSSGISSLLLGRDPVPFRHKGSLRSSLRRRTSPSFPSFSAFFLLFSLLSPSSSEPLCPRGITAPASSFESSISSAWEGLPLPNSPSSPLVVQSASWFFRCEPSRLSILGLHKDLHSSDATRFGLLL